MLDTTNVKSGKNTKLLHWLMKLKKAFFVLVIVPLVVTLNTSVYFCTHKIRTQAKPGSFHYEATIRPTKHAAKITKCKSIESQ